MKDGNFFTPLGVEKIDISVPTHTEPASGMKKNPFMTIDSLTPPDSDLGIKQTKKPKKSEATKPTKYDSSLSVVPAELSEAMRRELSQMLHNHAATPVVRNVVIDSPKERVVIRFEAPEKNLSCDIDVPLDISANDLIVGLNAAYGLGIDVSDMQQCHMCCENPVALIKGKQLLGELGVRDGSLITYYR